MKDTDAKSETLGGIFLVSICWLVILLPIIASFVVGEVEIVRIYQDIRETPCTVVAHEVEDGPPDEVGPYWVAIRYEYVVRGNSYRSDRFELWFLDRGIGFSTPDKRRALQDQYPVGLKTTCWVDVQDPRFAVLVREWRSVWTRWPGLTAILGFIAALIALWSGWSLRSRGVDLRRVLMRKREGPVG